MTPILCCGETLEEREAGGTEEKVARPGAGRARRASRPSRSAAWSSPTSRSGRSAPAAPPRADDAQAVCALDPRDGRRAWPAPRPPPSVRIQYGGSVKPAQRRRADGPARHRRRAGRRGQPRSRRVRPDRAVPRLTTADRDAVAARLHGSLTWTVAVLTADRRRPRRRLADPDPADPVAQRPGRRPVRHVRRRQWHVRGRIHRGRAQPRPHHAWSGRCRSSRSRRSSWRSASNCGDLRPHIGDTGGPDAPCDAALVWLVGICSSLTLLPRRAASDDNDERELHRDDRREPAGAAGWDRSSSAPSRSRTASTGSRQCARLSWGYWIAQRRHHAAVRSTSSKDGDELQLRAEPCCSPARPSSTTDDGPAGRDLQASTPTAVWSDGTADHVDRLQVHVGADHQRHRHLRHRPATRTSSRVDDTDPARPRS